MTRLQTALLLALLSCSCGDDGISNGPPIDPSTSPYSAGTSEPAETSSGGTGLTPCENYLGCVHECDATDAECEPGCEQNAGVDGQACADTYCDDLLSRCDLDNTDNACSDHAMYCTGGTGDGSESTTAAEPDPCDGYFGCTLVCGATPECLEMCAGQYDDVDVAACEEQRCDALARACSPSNQDACDDLVELCPLDDTSSGGASGSSSSGAST